MPGVRFFFGNAITAKRLRSKGCYRYRVTGMVAVGFRLLPASAKRTNLVPGAPTENALRARLATFVADHLQKHWGETGGTLGVKE
jgi:hypothetical protein